jgi:hypothetical protein
MNNELLELLKDVKTKNEIVGYLNSVKPMEAKLSVIHDLLSKAIARDVHVFSRLKKILSEEGLIICETGSYIYGGDLSKYFTAENMGVIKRATKGLGMHVDIVEKYFVILKVGTKITLGIKSKDVMKVVEEIRGNTFELEEL